MNLLATSNQWTQIMLTSYFITTSVHNALWLKRGSIFHLCLEFVDYSTRVHLFTIICKSVVVFQRTRNHGTIGGCQIHFPRGNRKGQ